MMDAAGVVGGGGSDADAERTVKILGRTFPRSTIIARLFYLCFFASFGSLFPLLAVYFKQLGMSGAQVFLSSSSLIVFTLAIGFVQTPTPFCVILREGADLERLREKGNESCFMELTDAGKVIHGGALGLLKDAAGIGRRRKRAAAAQIFRGFIDPSLFDQDEVAGMAPEFILKEKVCNYDEARMGVLVSPPHSSRVYRKPAVELTFMLLLILVVLSEFCSTPGLQLADAATLSAVADAPKEFGKIRLFGSVGWGLAMFVMGIGLDYSDTFRNHPCPTTNTTEKNYTLCFVMCSIFMGAAVLIATQFKFGEQSARPDEVCGLVMDTRTDEVAPAVAEKARARQLTAIRALASPHVALYLISVMVIGFGAGLVFAFLYWHLQDLGGSPVLFGISSVVNHASEIAAFFYTFQVINKFGHVKVCPSSFLTPFQIMYICLLTNVLRFFVLSWLDNPWMVLPLQVLQGFVLATMWASASSYISLISPAHIKPTAQSILMITYHGVGKSVGAMLGGLLISNIGTRLVFFFYALLCLAVFGISYGLNRVFKYEGIKYSAGMFDEDEMQEALAPQGLPMRHKGDNLTDAFAQPTAVMNSNYGAIDPTQDAYDRYVNTGSY